MNLVEIFSSVQGEGPDVGVSTLFVRFGECDLRCSWCDSPGTWLAAERCRIQRARGSGVFDDVPNPVPLAQLVEAATRLDAAAHRQVSLTGGEPLLQPDAVRAAAEALGGLGPEVLLETHGLHHGALAAVIDRIDVLSMDWKLASDVRRASDPKSGVTEPFHEAHARFLAVARAAGPRLRSVVKVVVTPATRDAEVEAAARRVAATHPGATLVLQPVTPCGRVRERPSAARMLALLDLAEAQHLDVRVIPQTHPVYGAP
jgi:organic radical activating enzyme